MKCSVCSQETSAELCPTCGHHVSGADATGTYSVDSTSEFPAVRTVADIPVGHAALMVMRGPQSGELWTLDSPNIEVGRADDCGLFLDDITVSRHHAFFKRTDAGWTLEDQGSLNGSYVNRLLISEPTRLQSGDEVQLGKFKFTFFEGRS